MKTLCKHYPVTVMSRVFDVSKSGYYTWLKRAPSKRRQDNARLDVAIKAAHVRTRQSYGPERLRDELAADGFPSGVAASNGCANRWAFAASRRKFKATTNSNHGLPVAENLLQQDFSTDRPHQVWVTDISQYCSHDYRRLLKQSLVCTAR